MIITLRRFDVGTARAHLIRYSILLMLILLVTHFVSYGKLPFQPDYQFPWLSFGIISVFGFVICTTNWVVLRLVELPKLNHPVKQLLLQLGTNSLSSLVVYGLLYYIINLAIFGASFRWFHFLKYLLVCQSIALGYVATMLAIRRPSIAESKPEKIIIKTGNQFIGIHPDEIAFFQSNNSIILIKLTNGCRYVTQFNTLKDLEGQLPSTAFYRVNRQFILHKNVIKKVENGPNKSLQLTLDDGETMLSVSRYKRKEFKAWWIG